MAKKKLNKQIREKDSCNQKNCCGKMPYCGGKDASPSALGIVLNIKNLHLHFDEHMESENFYHSGCCDCDADDSVVVDMWVKHELDKMYLNLEIFEYFIFSFVSIVFSTAYVLILPFVSLYTSGITDVEYIIPVYASLIHHFFGYPNWLQSGNTYFGIINDGANIMYLVGKNGRICVAMFAFLSGYAFYLSDRKVGKINWVKIGEFLLKYWLILFLFYIPHNAIFHGGYLVNGISFLRNLFGVGNCLSYFAWYVWFYCLIMIIMPYVEILLRKKKDYIACILLCIVLYFFITVMSNKSLPVSILSEFFTYFPCVLLGYYICRFKLFDQIAERCPAWVKNRFIVLVCIMLIFVLRYILGQRKILDVFLIAPFVFLLTLVLSDSAISKSLLKLSAHSTNLWFLHGVYFYGGGYSAVAPLFTKIRYSGFIMGHNHTVTCISFF